MEVDALRVGGYEPEYKRVDTPADTQAAIQNEHSWDAVLSDYSGASTLDALKVMHQDGRDVPFIVISTPIENEKVVAVMRAGAHGYVLKSNLDRLAVVLEREVREAGERTTLKKAENVLKEKEERRLSNIADDAIAREDATEVRDLTFDSFIKTLSSTIDSRDPVTAGHSDRVAEYALLIGKELKLSSNDMALLKYASLLHDIGKIGICEAILLKEGPLTEKEFRQVQKHALYSYQILKNVHFEPSLQEIPDIAAAHHERMDGTGYHRGLRNGEIPFLSRVLAVADVLDAITSHRHYRERMPFDCAIGLIEKDSGTHFDPRCVAALLQVKLTDLSRMLLKQHGGQYDESGQQLLRKLDKDISIAEYQNIIKKKDQSEDEAETCRIFNGIYSHSSKD